MPRSCLAHRQRHAKLTLPLFVRRRRPTAAVLLLVEHGVEFFRIIRVDRQQFVDHLSDSRVFPDPRVRVHDRIRPERRQNKTVRERKMKNHSADRPFGTKTKTSL